MRICVYGAGAIGGHFAVLLAEAGHQVSVIARGEHLTAIRRSGLTLVTETDRRTIGVHAEEHADALGPQDAVLVTLKATGLPGLSKAIAPLLGPDSVVVFAQNGIPWWYAHGLASVAPTPPDLAFLDPGRELEELLPRALGGVVRAKSELSAPGVVLTRTRGAPSLIVGEPDDVASSRAVALRAVLAAAGIASPQPDAIRAAVWSKLLANMTSSILCLLTAKSAVELRASTLSDRVLGGLRGEAASIAAAHGVTLPLASRQADASGHRPSILQDFEQRRPLELDALVVAPLKFARAVGLATPSLDLMAALAVQRAVDAGLYAPATDLPF